MSDINLENQNNNIHDEAVLKDYEVVKKLSFWASIIYKIKNGKAQKFLPSADLKPQKTYKSISYMWNMGNLRTSLFNTLDSIRNFFINPFTKSPINSLEAQIIGKSDSTAVINEPNLNFIIPKPINLNKKNN